MEIFLQPESNDFSHTWNSSELLRVRGPITPHFIKDNPPRRLQYIASSPAKQQKQHDYQDD